MKVSKELKAVMKRWRSVMEHRTAELILKKGYSPEGAVEFAEEWVADQCEKLGGLEKLEEAISNGTVEELPAEDKV